MSDTRNVKLGVCRITWGGVDLGYTKGGVEVAVTTETKKVTVDQFGNSEINEYIMGRTVTVTAPLAETTVENLNRIMPGSSLTVAGGVKATGSITFAAQPVAGDTITLNGAVFKFVTGAPGAQNEIEIGAALSNTLANAVQVLSATTAPAVRQGVYTASASAINIEAADFGTSYNAFTLAADGDDISVSGATLVGGEDARKRADVTNGIGLSLLALAKELVLHPIGLPEDDRSEDFVIPLAGTAGAATFSYKVDEERILPVQFTGYPDPVTRVLFLVGDPNA